MLFHAVLFNYKDDVTEEKKKTILDLAYSLLMPIPGVSALHAGRSIKEDAEFEYAITMLFEGGQPALQAYRDHPDHVRFRDIEFFPFLKDKLGLDYED